MVKVKISVATKPTFLTRKQPMYDLKMGIMFKFYCMSGNTLYLWLVLRMKGDRGKHNKQLKAVFVLNVEMYMLDHTNISKTPSHLI